MYQLVMEINVKMVFVMVKGRFKWWHNTEISDKKYIEGK